jgi:hypothetical protein
MRAGTHAGPPGSCERRSGPELTTCIRRRSERRGAVAGQAAAESAEPGEASKRLREARHVGRADEEQFLDEGQPRAPALRLVRVGEACADRSGVQCPERGAVVGQPQVEGGVGVERELTAQQVRRQPAGEVPVGVAGQKGHQAVGHDHRRPVGGNGVEPARRGQIRADEVGAAAPASGSPPGSRCRTSQRRAGGRSAACAGRGRSPGRARRRRGAARGTSGSGHRGSSCAPPGPGPCCAAPSVT